MSASARRPSRTQQQRGQHRNRAGQQERKQQTTIFVDADARLDQQQQPHSGKQVQHDQRQQNLDDDGGADRCRGESAPAHQRTPTTPPPDAGHRQQAIDRFAYRGDPKQIAEAGAVPRIVRAQQTEPAERRTEEKTARDKVSATAAASRRTSVCSIAGKVCANSEGDQQGQAQQAADVRRDFQTRAATVGYG